MTQRTLEKIAKELGMKITYESMGIWDYVPVIGSTFLVFMTGSGNMTSICHVDELETRPWWFTTEYIKACIRGGWHDLGGIDMDYIPFSGKKKYIPNWDVSTILLKDAPASPYRNIFGAF